MLSKALLNFVKLTDGDFESKTNTIVSSIKGNPHFTDPVPSVALLEAAALNYSTALDNASTGNRSDIATKKSRRKELYKLLRGLARYVNFKAAGDRIKLLTSGFNISNETRQPITITITGAIKIKNGDNPGELLLAIPRVKGARGYTHEIRLEDGTVQNWQTNGVTTSRCLFTNLQSGQRYSCRIGAMGARGQLVYSDIVTRVVL